jgi:hypothetical protein
VLEASMPGGVPVQGMVLNATATEATASTFLTLYPGGSPLPLASNVNVKPGQNVPNLAVARLSSAETLDVYNLTGNLHYVLSLEVRPMIPRARVVLVLEVASQRPRGSFWRAGGTPNQKARKRG